MNWSLKIPAAQLMCGRLRGIDWDAFVLAICERGLSGVECLAGIPGLVGGTPVQNVGAYGQEVAEDDCLGAGAGFGVDGVRVTERGGVRVWVPEERLQLDGAGVDMW